MRERARACVCLFGIEIGLHRLHFSMCNQKLLANQKMKWCEMHENEHISNCIGRWDLSHSTANHSYLQFFSLSLSSDIGLEYLVMCVCVYAKKARSIKKRKKMTCSNKIMIYLACYRKEIRIHIFFWNQKRFHTDDRPLYYYFCPYECRCRYIKSTIYSLLYW